MLILCIILSYVTQTLPSDPTQEKEISSIKENIREDKDAVLEN